MKAPTLFTKAGERKHSGQSEIHGKFAWASVKYNTAIFGIEADFAKFGLCGLVCNDDVGYLIPG